MIGSFYNLNPCKPVVSTNRTFCAFQNNPQILYLDNYFHRCIGVGKAGPKISLFDPKHLENGLVVDYDLFPNSNGQLIGAQLFIVCDEKVEFDAHYIGKSKKFFQEEYTFNFKAISKYACPKNKNSTQNKSLIRGL